jgi:hypothetical protein
VSWEVKYRTEHKDIYGVDWKTDIEEDSYAGAIINLTSTDEPLIIEWEKNSDDIFDVDKPSQAILEVLSETNFAIADIYAVQDIQFRMSIYQDDVLYWRGFVNSRNYSEPYDTPPYPVTITAVCGLEFLNDYMYASSIDVTAGVETVTYYSGLKLESQIILDILGKLGISTFTEYINIYEDSHTTGVGDSPLDQTKIDVDVFKGMYCLEVLINILAKYNACITSVAGGFVIYRPVELTDSTVYGRVFTAVTTKTATTLTPAQYIHRLTHTSTLKQLDGGRMMITRPAKYVKVFHDYGSRESWLKNYQFEGYRFSGQLALGDNPEEWEEAGFGAGVSTLKASRYLPAERDGIVINGRNNYPDTSKYIYQEFATNAIISSDDFVLQFDYQWLSNKGSTAIANDFYFSLQDVALSKYLVIDDGYTCSWQAGANIMTITEDVFDGFSGWKTWMRRISGLEANGPYIIKFYAVDDSEDIVIAIRNVIFKQSKDKVSYVPDALGFLRYFGTGSNFTINLNTKDSYVRPTEYTQLEYIEQSNYVVNNGINGKLLGYKYILGDITDSGIDNIIEEYKGVLIIVSRDSLSDTANDFVTDHAADYTAGGVAVTAASGVLSFTGQATATKLSGDDFAGATSITNTSGNIAGTVTNFQAYVTSVARIDRAYPTSDEGTANITFNGITKLMTLGPGEDEEDACANFVTAHEADFGTGGVTISYAQQVGGLYDGAWYVQFQMKQAGTDATGASSFSNVSGILDGVIPTIQANVAGQVRIDKITLTGLDGTADITCDGVTEEVDVDETVSATDAWNTRGGSEDKELLKIIGDEIAAQYARPKQLIQMPIMETGESASSLNIIGNFQDDLNQYSGSNRKFVFNRGEFNTKYRKWNIDLCEVI